MYNRVMRKLLSLILLFSILSLPIFAQEAEDVKINKDNAYKEMAKSNAEQHEICRNISRNFRRDNLFTSYMQTRCTQFAAERQHALAVLYPYPNKGIENYNEKYPVLLSSYAINLNKKEIEDYKNVVKEYCTYAARRVTKKDPEVCSESRIKSLFDVKTN